MSSNRIERAYASLGSSSDPVYRMVRRALETCDVRGGLLLDVGCGAGALRGYIASLVDEYIAADVVRYEGLPSDVRFVQVDLDAGRVPLPDGSADVVVAVETVEHLENPRAFFRELRRLVKSGGLVVVTTPNQLSLLSLLTLLTKCQFNAFQKAPGLYPAHITALLESDLVRISHEVGLTDVKSFYSNHGRMPFSRRAWQTILPLRGRRFSDNVVCLGRAD